MKFAISAAALSDALDTAIRALSSRVFVPFLEGVLVEADDHSVRVTCSDSNLTISVRLDAEVEQAGAIIAPGRLFADFIRRSRRGVLTINVNPNRNIRISCDGSRLNLKGMSADEYPRPNPGAGAGKIVLPHSVLKDMIEKTLPFIAPAEIRETLTGCLLEARTGNVTMVGMDGFRMAKATHMCSSSPDDAAAIIPGKAAAELQRLLKGDDELCEITLGANGLHAEIGNVDFYTRLIAGQYIDHERLIPTTYATRVRIETKPLQDSVNRAAIIAKEGNTRLIRFEIDDTVMHIAADSEIANMNEDLPVETSGNALSVAFNIKYIVDALRGIEAPELEFAFNSNVQPCTITSPGHPGYTILILPVRMTH